MEDSAQHYVTDKTNGDIIALFSKVFGNALVNGLPAWYDALARAQMIKLGDDRSGKFSGPAVERWEGLTSAEIHRLVRAL